MNYQITLNRETLQFLQDNNVNDRFTKLDALVDLLESVAGEPTPNVNFTTTITDLADEWGWNRTNVRLFLNSLENLGLLSLDRQGKTTLITLGASFGEQEASVRVLDDEQRDWLRFIMGMASLDCVISMFGRSFDALDDCFDKISNPEEVGRRLRDIVGHLILDKLIMSQEDDETRLVDDVLRSLFIDECRLDLGEFIRLLAFGGLSILKGEDNASPVANLGEQTLRKLQAVFSYYKSWIGQSQPRRQASECPRMHPNA